MSSADGFWGIVCRYANLVYLLLLVVTVLFFLNVLAMVLGAQSEGAFAITVLNFVLLGVTGLGAGAILWHCQRT